MLRTQTFFSKVSPEQLQSSIIAGLPLSILQRAHKAVDTFPPEALSQATWQALLCSRGLGFDQETAGRIATMMAEGELTLMQVCDSPPSCDVPPWGLKKSF